MTLVWPCALSFLQYFDSSEKRVALPLLLVQSFLRLGSVRWTVPSLSISLAITPVIGMFVLSSYERCSPCPPPQLTITLLHTPVVTPFVPYIPRCSQLPALASLCLVLVTWTERSRKAPPSTFTERSTGKATCIPLVKTFSSGLGGRRCTRYFNTWTPIPQAGTSWTITLSCTG